MSAAERIAALRACNPAAVDLAAACALAARVEPDLLRRLRLLVPGADAATEADLWFSDLLAGRDAAAIALDPLVGAALREDLRAPSLVPLREAAVAEIGRSHAGAHWSVRLEERVHYLDTARPAGFAEDIDDLLVAALDRLRTEPDPRGVARWLLGAAGRHPAIRDRTATRACEAAAALHLDRTAPDPALLAPSEAAAWLPWLTQSMPLVPAPVHLVDGAVVLGASHESAVPIDLPDTDPLVVEVRWHDGVAARSQLTRFRVGEPVQVETGARSVDLVSLTGTSYNLSPAVSLPAGRFDHLKVGLRPCLARESEVGRLVRMLREPRYGGRAFAIAGRPGCGNSTLLVAVTDALVEAGTAVVEYFFTGADDAEAVTRSCLAQLAALYPRVPVGGSLEQAFVALEKLGDLERRPLVVALDGEPTAMPLPDRPPPGVRYVQTGLAMHSALAVESVGPDRDSDRRVCLALLARDAAAVERAFAEPVRPEAVADLVDDLPRNLVRLLSWIRGQPPDTVLLDAIPPMLTTRWPGILERLSSRWPDRLDLLRAADGRNTRLDCAEAEGASPDNDDVGNWDEFWSACVAEGIVADTDPSEVVRLAAPLPIEPGLFGHRMLGLRHDTPAAFARTAPPTRFASAVTHALAAGDLRDAAILCTDLDVLTRRYATDPQGLLADVDAVATRTARPDLRTLHAVLQILVRDGVPPAGFLAALHDTLTEYATLHAVPDLAEAPTLPPLRVRTVQHDLDLRASHYVRTWPGPALAVAAGSGEDAVVVTADSFGGGDDVIGAVGGRDGYVAWGSGSLRWGGSASTGSAPLDVPVDFAARVGSRAITASADGTITIWDSGPPRRLVGHSGRVTAVAGNDSFDLISASVDGTVRCWSGTRVVRRGSPHRGSVSCLATIPMGFVSGGEDGFLVFWGESREVRHQAGQAAVTCVVALADGSVVSGAADGSVGWWDPVSGNARVLGRHTSPVRGLDVLATGVVVSWANSVCFWDPYLPSAAVGTAGGFPGGVRAFVPGEQTYTVLCGDRSVHRRLLPTEGADLADRPELGCLAVVGDRIYFGLDGTLYATQSSGGADSVVGSDIPIVQAAAMSDEGLAVRDSSGGVFYIGRPGEGPERGVGISLVAADRSTHLAAVAADSRAGFDTNDRLTELPAPASALAVSGDRLLAGLPDGRVQILDAAGVPVRLLGGDGVPVTAVAGLPDGAVVTGSATGTVCWWPADPDHGPAAHVVHSGPVIGVASVGDHVLTAGDDGRIILWYRGAPVHELPLLRSPIRALDARPGLAAARDGRGRLWTFTVDSPQWTSVDELVRVSAQGETLIVALVSSVPYEVMAIRCYQGGRVLPLYNEGHWPVVAEDGTLTAPWRPEPSQPLYLRCPGLDRGPQAAEANYALTLRSPAVAGYHSTVRGPIAVVPIEQA